MVKLPQQSCVLRRLPRRARSPEGDPRWTPRCDPAPAPPAAAAARCRAPHERGGTGGGAGAWDRGWTSATASRSGISKETRAGRRASGGFLERSPKFGGRAGIRRHEVARAGFRGMRLDAGISREVAPPACRPSITAWKRRPMNEPAGCSTCPCPIPFDATYGQSKKKVSTLYPLLKSDLISN
jgi:hypothetical protein